MKIFLTNTGPWGTGSFTVAHAIVQEFLKLGHEVILFFPDTGIKDEDLEYFKKNSQIYKIWNFPIQVADTTLKSFPLMIPDPHPRSIGKLTYKEMDDELFHGFSSLAANALDELIDHFKPDIIECQHIWLFDYLVSKKRFPFINTAHHSDQMGFKYDPRIRPLALDSSKKSFFIFAISEYVKQEVMKIYQVPEKKIRILSNGYDHSIFFKKNIDRNEICRKFNLDIPKDAKIFSFAGKISKTKGIDTLIQANQQLKQDNVHFLIMGSGSLDAVLDKEQIDKYYMKNIHILGHVAAHTLADVHNISDFSILPSRSEGFGIAALEPMGCGLPVVGSSHGGLKEFAVGRLIPPEDPDLLACTIKEVLALSKDEYKALQNKALKKASEFSWKAVAEKRIDFYQEAIEAYNQPFLKNIS